MSTQSIIRSDWWGSRVNGMFAVYCPLAACNSISAQSTFCLNLTAKHAEENSMSEVKQIVSIENCIRSTTIERRPHWVDFSLLRLQLMTQSLNWFPMFHFETIFNRFNRVYWFDGIRCRLSFLLPQDARSNEFRVLCRTVRNPLHGSMNFPPLESLQILFDGKLAETATISFINHFIFFIDTTPSQRFPKRAKH